jgi:hypothetical protein
MADTTTANYGWVKPDIGASDSTWGGKLNTDLDGIDSTVSGVSAVANSKLADAPNDANQYVRKGGLWVPVTQTSLGGPFLPSAGGTVTGPITLPGNPTALSQASNKAYVDGQVGLCLPLTGGALSGNLGAPAYGSAGGAPLSIADPPAGNNSKLLATTEWINAAIKSHFPRNRLINGSFTLDDYNNKVSITPVSGAFVANRWKIFLSQAGKLTTQALTWNMGPPGPTGLVAVSTGAYTPVAADAHYIAQIIEHSTVADFMLGTANPNFNTMTLSFWAAATVAGTYSGALVSQDGVRNYVFTYTVAAGNTWQYFVIPGIPIEAANNGNYFTSGSGPTLILRFDLGSGSTYRTSTLNTWISAGNLVGANGAANLISQGANNNLWLSAVQLEAGPVASLFDWINFAQLKDQCYRYYCNTQASVFVSGYGLAGNTVYSYWQLPVQMRAPPTNTNSAFSSITNLTSGSIAVVNDNRTLAGSGVIVATGYGTMVWALGLWSAEL